MTKLRRPSPALVVAFLALLVALGGSAGADPVAFVAKTIKGKTLKKGSVPANRLKPNSVTGKQVAESKLGRVPRAKAADTAKTAGRALIAGSAASSTSAGTATSAGVAERAKALDGHQVSTVKRATPTAGATLAAAREAAPRIPLGGSGPFTLYGKCTRDQSGPATRAEVFLASGVEGVVFGSEENVLAGNAAFLDTATPEAQRLVTSSEASAVYARLRAFGFVAIPPAGQSYGGIVAVAVRQGAASTGGAYGDGDACLFTSLAEAG